MHAGQEACYLPAPIDFNSWKRNPVWRDYFKFAADDDMNGSGHSPNASYGEPRRMDSERVFTE
jgi:hypothetical protein